MKKSMTPVITSPMHNIGTMTRDGLTPPADMAVISLDEVSSLNPYNTAANTEIGRDKAIV